MERTTESLSITLAISGRCSEICKSPLVLTGLNSPPFLEFGFRSHMSMVGAPPPSQIRMQAFWLLFTSAALACRWERKCVAPMAVALPMAIWLRKCRRDMLFEKEFNMGLTFFGLEA